MAILTLKAVSKQSIAEPVTVTLKAEKITEQPERWFLSFVLPKGAEYRLEFSTTELDDIFLAYEMIRPVVKWADRLEEPPIPDPEE